jgi:hypothetical protein
MATTLENRLAISRSALSPPLLRKTDFHPFSRVLQCLSCTRPIGLLLRCAHTRRSCGKRACVPFRCSAQSRGARPKRTATLILPGNCPGCQDGPPPTNCAGAAHHRATWQPGGPFARTGRKTPLAGSDQPGPQACLLSVPRSWRLFTVTICRVLCTFVCLIVLASCAATAAAALPDP